MTTLPWTTPEDDPSHGRKRKHDRTPSDDSSLPENAQRTLLGIDWVPCRGCRAGETGPDSGIITVMNLQGTYRWCRIIHSGLELYGVLDSLLEPEGFYIAGWVSLDQLILRVSTIPYFLHFFRDSKPKSKVWSYGRISNRVAPDALSAKALQLASSWLHECRHQQTECSSRNSNYFPKRVIDVGNDLPRLIEEPHAVVPGPYIALSYCWGPNPQLVTTVDSLEAHKQSIPPSSMPLTLQHTIYVARQLGFRYLWVDALCIIQDSAPDWEEQAARMYDIYEGAVVTIAADVGSNSASGLSCCEKRSYLHGKSIPGKDLSVCVKPYKVAGGLYVNTYKETPTHRPANSPHNNDTTAAILRNHNSILQAQAWAFQERNLSKRVLHFGEFEMGWECNDSTRCECTEHDRAMDFERVLPRVCAHSHTSYPGKDARKIDWDPSKWANDPRKCFFYRGDRDRNLRESGAQLKQFVQGCALGYYRFDTKDLFSKSWRTVVENYSKRALTVPSDRLPALSGLASRAAKGLPLYSVYLAGLWKRNLARNLLWHTNREDRGTRSEEYIAPSWSWASIQGIGVHWTGYDQMWDARDVTFKMEDVACTPQRAVNPFGAVKDGWIKAWCFTLPFSVTPDNQMDFSHVKGLIEAYPDLSSLQEFESGQSYMMVEVCSQDSQWSGGGLLVR